MNNEIVIINRDEALKKEKNIGSEFHHFKQEITKRDKFDQAYVAIYTLPPNKKTYPMHYHVSNTEAFYIISGKGKVLTQTTEHEVKKGDVIVFPPGEKGTHQIINNTNEELVYIDFDTQNSPDVVVYPNSEKVGVIIRNQSADFFKSKDKVDYFEGE